MMLSGIMSTGILLLENAIIALIFVRYTWKCRAIQGPKYLCFMMFSIAIWSLTEALQDMSMYYSMKISWPKVCYLGIDFASPFWLHFTLDYHYGERVKSWLASLIWMVPLLIFLAAANNVFHHLLWPTIIWGSPEYGHLLIHSHDPRLSS